MNRRPHTSDRARLGLPNKGRLARPAISLLKEAGFTFEEDERRLFAPCSNFPLDLLFLRAEDIGEYCQDGVVDVGITGSNLVDEAGAEVARGPGLGFGHCCLQLGVPIQGPIERLEDVEGLVVATSHPRLTAAFFAKRELQVELVGIKGAVEITPLLGVADAIVDLVATGTTMATNGLRPIATLLDSEAELVTNTDLSPGRAAQVRHVALMLESVLAAREKKYLMMNAPLAALGSVRSVIPGMGSPSVIQLADPAMVAVHAVVEAAAVWELLGPLRDAGASSILVLAIEQLIP